MKQHTRAVKDFISIFLCIFLCTATLFSEVYIAKKQYHHHCTGENCPVCRIIHISLVFLHTLTVSCVTAISIQRFFIRPAACDVTSQIQSVLNTLISQKVKLSY